MRAAFIIMVLALAACSPPATAPVGDAAPAEAADPAAAERAANVALLAEAAPVEGQWFAFADEGEFSAGFGLPESEYQFTLVCQAPTGNITLTASRDAPAGAAEIRVRAGDAVHAFAGESYPEGLPTVRAELAGHGEAAQALIAAVSPPQERFGVEVAGEIEVYPWDESVAQALGPCA